jgi:hypothetical protein
MGKCFFDNGNFYAGAWKNDKMDTTFSTEKFCQDAIYIAENGMYRYFGQFKESLKHGRGVEYQEKKI